MGFWCAIEGLDSGVGEQGLGTGEAPVQGFRVWGLGFRVWRGTSSALDMNTRLGDFDATIEATSPVEEVLSLC